ncbi:MAG TPA: 4Fe-4S binding protein [Dongiaceae bacterium]|jgi:polyferredoxin|nr:4Fe-4S binding protein [Dongiaceae bacterium]
MIEGLLGRGLARVGRSLLHHQKEIRRLQWAVVAFYLLLIIGPVLLPLPSRTAHLWSNLTLFAQFVFWGIWWPFVLLSMAVVGRAWCGIFCPEGTLSEWASAHGRARALPRWLVWRGWPFAAFVLTTLYGQLVSVYQYPGPTLLILGGSSAAAMAVGYLYGRNKRVWCRYLCPVNGVFALLAKLAPLSFAVDEIKWRDTPPRAAPNCAPLVPIRTMTGSGGCHMCGRCADFREAVALSPRSPNQEVVHPSSTPAWPETALILYGLFGVAMGAFHWSSSPYFIFAKNALAEWLLAHNIVWPLGATLPWSLLTNYPANQDVLTVLDGALLVFYIAAMTLIMGSLLLGFIVLAVRVSGVFSWERVHHAAHSLIPLAGAGVFLGLSAIGVSLLRGEGFVLAWLPAFRVLFLLGASLWSGWLAFRIICLWTTGWCNVLASFCLFAAIGLGLAGWMLPLWW